MAAGKAFKIWLGLAILWCAAAAWIEWDKLTRKPWTLDWTFSFWGHGPAKSQMSAFEIVVLPPLALLIAGAIYFWLKRARR